MRASPREGRHTKADGARAGSPGVLWPHGGGGRSWRCGRRSSCRLLGQEVVSRLHDVDHHCLQRPCLGGAELVPPPGLRGRMQHGKALGGKGIGPPVAQLVLRPDRTGGHQLGGGVALDLAEADRGSSGSSP